MPVSIVSIMMLAGNSVGCVVVELRNVNHKGMGAKEETIILSSLNMD